MKTEGPWELGDLLEGQNLVRDLIARVDVKSGNAGPASMAAFRAR